MFPFALDQSLAPDALPYGAASGGFGGGAGSARQCAVVMPVVKSVQTQTGGWVQEGIASSERRDVTNEIMALSKAPPWLLSYLKRCGSVDWNHGRHIIGKCVDGRWLTDRNEIRKSLHPMMHDTTLPAIWVKNDIHPLPKDRNRWDEGHVEFHNLAEAGHPLFMSAYGKGLPAGAGTNSSGESGNVVVPLVYTRIAVTPEPVNPDCFGTVTLAKSLSEFYRELAEGDSGVRNGVAREAHELPALIYIAENSFGFGQTPQYQSLSEVEKSLSVTGVLPVGGTTGGDSMKTCGPTTKGGSGGPRCRRCKHSIGHPAARYCDQCGKTLYDAQSTVETISKALEFADLNFKEPMATLCR